MKKSRVFTLDAIDFRRYILRVLPLRITECELIVYGPDVNEVGRHTLLPSDCVRQQQLLPQHRPSDNRKQQLESLKASFAEWGDVGQRFLSGLLERQKQGQAQARKVLALRAHYHSHDLLRALERALAYGAFSFAQVERILQVQAQPKSMFQTLADQEKQHLEELLGHASVEARPAQEYQCLLFDEPYHDEEENQSQPNQSEQAQCEERSLEDGESQHIQPDDEPDSDSSSPAGP